MSPLSRAVMLPALALAACGNRAPPDGEPGGVVRAEPKVVTSIHTGAPLGPSTPPPPRFPHADQSCETDADCALLSLRTVGPRTCCGGPESAFRKSYVDGVRDVCIAWENEHDLPPERCPPSRPPWSGPVACRDGRCEFTGTGDR